MSEPVVFSGTKGDHRITWAFDTEDTLMMWFHTQSGVGIVFTVGGGQWIVNLTGELSRSAWAFV